MTTIVNIDYLNFTHRHADTENPFAILRRAQATVAQISSGLVIGDIEEKGLHGYTFSFRVEVARTGETAGFVAAGGTNFGSILYSFSGKGCRQLNNRAVHDLLQRTGGKITRIDICYDDLQGTRTVHDVRKAYRAGEFKNRGQNPKCDLAGPWDSKEHWGDGLTFYVGKRQTGKMLRAYEKGKQLGDANSPWMRFEVELRAEKRVIAIDSLLRPLDLFIACYSWLSWVAEEQGEPIGIIAKEETRIGLNHLIHHAKRSYGKLLSTLSSMGIGHQHMFSILSTVGTPRRIDRLYLFPEFVTDAHRHAVPTQGYVTEHGELLPA